MPSPRQIFLAVFAVLALLAPPAQAQALKGVALIVGQSKYEHISPLPNPANDARDVVKLMTDLGFDARSVSDRDSGRLKRDLERFVEDAADADVAFLYYSGHGIEAGGENFLVPVDADLSSLSNADEALVSISAVLEELKSKVPVSIVLLDACRTNPFPADAVVRRKPKASGAKMSASGLTPVRGAAALTQPTATTESLGTVIGFAAEPGRPALDGPAGGNSPYAAALLRHLAAMKGAEFGAVMRMVTEEVYLDTRARQRPWINESLRRLLYFGMAPDEPTGDSALITGERRQLLLTIADLPSANRAQIELAAAKDGVPLDSLYGVLRALGADKIPEDPNELGKVLDSQAERLRKMFAEREALRADDREIVRLAGAADTAIREGAILTGRKFLDDAVARVEAASTVVDAAEDAVKQKRLADAAIYVRRADASALAFDHRAAAADYAKAFDLARKWDETLAWNYKNMEAEALHAHGAATGDRVALDGAVKAYETILGMVPYGQKTRDWAITRNNMAVVFQTMGERDAAPAKLMEAATIFRESLAVFAAAGDDANWAAAQNNIGNALLKLGERSGDPALLEEAIAALRAALDRRDRSKLPLDWASTQNNLGLALFALSDRQAGPESLVAAEAAYRAALEEYRRDNAPVQWAMVQNNLGNTLNALGGMRNDPAAYQEAAKVFRAALDVRTREAFPVSWATTRLNLGNALNNAARFDLATRGLEEAAAAYHDAIAIYTREKFPLDWAAVQNNLGSVYQTIGQRTGDPGRLEESAAAFRATQEVYRRDALPLDWAMSNFNLGNTLQLMGAMANDAARYAQAADAYRAALEAYRRDTSPRQWAMAQAALGASLQWLATAENPMENLTASIAARRAALEVLTPDNAPVDWANAQNGLGMSLLNLGTFEQTAKYLAEAEAAFEASLKVFTREQQPLQWAFGQNNLGDVAWNRATQGGGAADYEKAIALFEKAKEGYVAAGYTAPVAITDQKIELIRKTLADRRG
jgi:uncharacterized caspase-like protein